jgi:hypothetical protein
MIVYNRIIISRPEIIVIMEPIKLANTIIKLLGFDSLCYSDCRGYVGGILVAWKSNVMSVQSVYS